jgi:hypothetical protein
MNQRANKRKLERGEPSEAMTAERAARLTALGFAWEGTKTHPLRRNEAEWEVQLARLAAYKAEHGDCNVRVRACWPEDPRLGTWVHTQRQGKRKLDRGEPSLGMTVERAARLAALGFAWTLGQTGAAPKAADWEAQLARLAAHKRRHGDCNVPQGWSEDPRLGRWVTNQRNRKRKLDRDEPSEGMTAARAARLTALGFAWEGTKRSSEDAQSSGSSSSAAKKRPRLRPTEPTESTGYRFLDSFAELCEVRNNVRLEGLYSRRWHRVAVTGVDGRGAGAHLLYLDTDETELLRPADFERRSWRVRGGARADKGADARAGGPRAGLAARPRRGLPPRLQRRPRRRGAHPRPAPPWPPYGTPLTPGRNVCSRRCRTIIAGSRLAGD